MHCRGHQKGASEIHQGNAKADQEAKRAALKPLTMQANCLTLWTPETQTQPYYSPEEVKQAKEMEAMQEDGWWVLLDQRVFVPGHMVWDAVKQVHSQLHMGKTALASALLWEVYINKIHSISANVCARCETCAANNPRQGPQPPPSHQPRRSYPFDSLMIDFTDMPRCGSFWAMLVIVCTYTA